MLIQLSSSHPGTICQGVTLKYWKPNFSAGLQPLIHIRFKTANAEKKAAFSALGKDESDVDRERWESAPSNIQYGLEYVNSLLEQGLENDIISVLKELKLRTGT